MDSFKQHTAKKSKAAVPMAERKAEQNPHEIGTYDHLKFHVDRAFHHHEMQRKYPIFNKHPNGDIEVIKYSDHDAERSGFHLNTWERHNRAIVKIYGAKAYDAVAAHPNGGQPHTKPSDEQIKAAFDQSMARKTKISRKELKYDWKRDTHQ